MKKEFHMAFQISKTIVFEVSYYTLGNNTTPYFTTEVGVFNRPKTDFNECGQCQQRFLTNCAYRFWRKWDCKHLHDLTDSEYKEMMYDLNELKHYYNYMEMFGNKGFSSGYSFDALKKLSMQKINAKKLKNSIDK